MELTDEIYSKLQRINELGDPLTQEASRLPYPKLAEQHAKEIRRLADDIRVYGPAFERLGFRLNCVVRELAEAERIARAGRIDTRQARRQRDLLAKAYENLAVAWEAVFDQLTVKGARIDGV